MPFRGVVKPDFRTWRHVHTPTPLKGKVPAVWQTLIMWIPRTLKHIDRDAGKYTFVNGDGGAKISCQPLHHATLLHLFFPL